jgi:putative hydrolase of the HAD superfamily
MADMQARGTKMAGGEGRGLLIFDADDTLWYTGRLYDVAYAKARAIVEAEGLDGAKWQEQMEAIDRGNIAKMGLNRERMPTSCVEAYLAMAGWAADLGVAEQVREAARGFMDKADLMEGVEEVLSQLVSEYRLVLLTQGDYALQVQRIEQSGLGGYFSEIVIPLRKNKDSLVGIVEADGRPVEHIWSIGNSFPSDINPALLLGLNGIWIPGYEWESDVVLEEAAQHRMVRAHSIGQVVEILTPALNVNLDS